LAEACADVLDRAATRGPIKSEAGE
jgi:hypothetical protein